MLQPLRPIVADGCSRCQNSAPGRSERRSAPAGSAGKTWRRPGPAIPLPGARTSSPPPRPLWRGTEDASDGAGRRDRGLRHEEGGHRQPRWRLVLCDPFRTAPLTGCRALSARRLLPLTQLAPALSRSRAAGLRTGVAACPDGGQGYILPGTERAKGEGASCLDLPAVARGDPPLAVGAPTGPRRLSCPREPYRGLLVQVLRGAGRGDPPGPCPLTCPASRAGPARLRHQRRRPLPRVPPSPDGHRSRSPSPAGHPASGSRCARQ